MAKSENVKDAMKKVQKVKREKGKKEDKKPKEGKKIAPPGKGPVSSKEILAKAVSISSFSLILGLNYVSRKRPRPRKPRAKCVIITKIYIQPKYSFLG